MSGFTNPEAYDRWMGRWSARLAPHFVDFAGLTGKGRYLDLGAGTGVLARAILYRFPEATVVGVEPSAPLLRRAREMNDDPRLTLETGDAEAIPGERGQFDAALGLLILQELSDAPAALREMRRVTRPGGIAATCQWDFKLGMPMVSLFWEAVEEVVPEKTGGKEKSRRVPLGYPDAKALVGLWRSGGLRDVHAAPLRVEMEFESFEDYWAPFLSGASPTTSYAPTLPTETREAVKARLRYKVVGDGPDRGFKLEARAWAVRGTVPLE